MKYLAPSILSANFLNLEKDIREAIEGGADFIHIDVMDGHFVPNLSLGFPIIKQIHKRFSIPLDVHLMISNAELYIEEYIEAGASFLTLHYEAVKHLHRYVEKIKQLGAKAGVSINPHTPIYNLEEILPYVDMILIMSVNPGFGGQRFIPTSVEKARKLKELIHQMELNPPPLIEMDGGINLENIDVLLNYVDIFVIGSSIFHTPNIYETTKKFKEKILRRV
ncbi:MAG: ribulose-phosphate 3-epimerase [Leptospiraceae bacterium]|nr:ribulose-phosphate 3-epimerase [Leptospiraceae bacterium]MDW7976586.1 ribulose-phosphate 3-epimerase [Leptospiraceae bacterium]